VPPPGALGAATGEIAIGTAEMSISTTIIISIVTTISIETSVAKAATGSTTHNTGEMRLMPTGKRRINLAGRGLAARVAGSRVLGLELVPVAELGLELDQVVAPELELVPVAPELELVPVAEPVLELVPVAALGLELVPVAEPVLELVPVAVALRTKLEIAAHRRDLVPVLAVEDLVVVAETTREPAAIEAAVVWAAAG